MIDKELFLKIPSSELNVLVWQQSSRNAPNIGALLAFSHRITCLIATEILRDDSEKVGRDFCVASFAAFVLDKGAAGGEVYKHSGQVR